MCPLLSSSGSPDVTHFCRDVAAQTGKEAQIVDATWALPTWNGLLTSDSSIIKLGRPCCCFKPECKEDVVAACSLAMRHGLKISARGSGHHYGGVSLVEGGLVLDLSALTDVEVDPVARTARVGPAASCRQLRAAMSPHGLHFPLPHLSDVGLSGYILGGGNGWGVRQWGAASDNVAEVEVVLLGGGGGDEGEQGCRLVRVRPETEPELFWGLRGGGAFLAIATEFLLRLHPVPRHLPLIAATYPLSNLGTLAEFFREFHSSNPPCVEASLCVVGGGGGGGDGSGGDGGAPAVVLACHSFAEPGSADVEASYSKLRALLPEARLSLQEGPMPYEQALCVLDSSWSWPGLCMYGHGAFVPVQSLRRGGGVVSALADAAASMTSGRSLLLVCPAAPLEPGCGAQVESQGGDATGALGFRDTLYMGMYGMWTRSEAGPEADGDQRHVAWVRACAASLEPHAAGLYVNEVMHDDPGQLRRSYEPAAYDRLLALKARVDPQGLLRAL